MRGVLVGSHLFHFTHSGNASYQLHSSKLRFWRHDWRPRPSNLDLAENNLESMLSMALESRICSLKHGIRGFAALNPPSSSAKPAGSQGFISGKSLLIYQH